MSLLPMLFAELDDLRQPADLFDQFFGDVLLREDLLQPRYLRPWRSQLPRPSGVSHVSDDKDGFKINLDVQQFKPDELAVKVVDGHVVVEGKHEERQDQHGYIKREFTRRYKLPGNINPDSVSSSLSSDGVLMVSAAKKALPGSNERPVPITCTQTPAVTASNDSMKEDKVEQ